MPTPRVFIVRHGETEWSLSGRHTGATDIPLTPAGETRIRATGAALVGPDRLIVPGRLACIYVSPRTRARRTLHLLLAPNTQTPAPIHVTDAVREWDYGIYEGRTTREIREDRKRRRVDAGHWDIWRDGCEGGERPGDVESRLDGLIREVRETLHRGRFGDDGRPSDVLIVAHGHILRSLAARWVGKKLEDNPGLILEAGGVGTLSYEHNSIDEPAILLGGAFVVDAVEKESEREDKTNG
ncbi:Sedoheptulose 1,7-bisphosphatase [Coniothyrium glycines]